MQKKGYTLSNNPDLIINIDTKSREDVYINRYNEYPYYGWYPFGMSMSTSYRPSSRIVGLLYIDVIDAKTGSLLWQGNGSGTLSSNKSSRDELINKLNEKGIGVAVHYKPIHQLSYYRKKYNYDKSQFPNSNALFKSIISLPLYPNLSNESVKYIINSIVELSKLFGK